VDYCAGRTRPLWEGWRVIAEGGVIDLVDKDTEESGGLVVWVQLKLGIDLDDECGGDGGKQASLLPLSALVCQCCI
jgi:hypothetical protein